jgi:thiol-disulfide isomerase/thioredoxin
MTGDNSPDDPVSAKGAISASRRNLLLAGAGVVACSAGALGGYAWLQRQQAIQPSAAKLLDAQFLGLDDQKITLSQWRGKTLLVNFWATWCGPCREEMPDFVRAQNEFGAKGLQIVGLAVDRKEPVQRFMRELGVNYPVLMADVAWLDEVKSMGNPQGVLPYSVVFSPRGDVMLNRVGKIKFSEITTIMS